MCGLLGNENKESGCQVYVDHKFGSWLYANQPPRPAMRGGFGRARGGQIGRGGSAGSGASRDMPCNNMYEDDSVELPELALAHASRLI
jgi:hypothetical protein